MDDLFVWQPIWRPIPYFTDYEMSSHGDVRNRFLNIRKRTDTIVLLKKGKKKRFKRKDLFRKIFPELSEMPEEGPPVKSKDSWKKDLPKRKCATCGCPTTDYRCPECWAKIRGGAIVTSDGQFEDLL
jgi:hypothetical protein